MATDDGGGGERKFEGAGAALEFAIWSLDQQQQALRDFDAKSERALTLAVAILAISAAASTFFLGADAIAASNRIMWLLASLALLLIFLAITWFSFHSQTALSMHLGPEGEHLLAISAEYTDLRTRQWLAEDIYRSINHNESVIATKSKRYKRLALAVLLEAIVAVAAIAAAVAA